MWKPDCKAFAVELIMSILLLATSWPASVAFFIKPSNCASVPVKSAGATFKTFLIAVSVSSIVLPTDEIALVYCLAIKFPIVYILNVEYKLVANPWVLLVVVPKMFTALAVLFIALVALLAL